MIKKSPPILALLFLFIINQSAAQLNPAWAPFYHGVASGDPLADRVIIWTRVTPDDLSSPSIEVDWKVATDPDLSNVIQSGTAEAALAKDYTVKVDVTGLQAGTTYYYGFSALGGHSLTGRTKTIPLGAVDHLKFAVLSCANFQSGYFNAYRRIAELNDLDAVIYLGDYFYEWAEGGDPDLVTARPIEPKTELISLEDYRLRYSTHHLDSCLARAHQQHPFIAIWDDHEFSNNVWTGGAGGHDPATEGNWEDRKAAARQAYFEWMPIRDNEDQSIHRSFRYGNLVDLIMLDTRLEGREEPVENALDPALQDPDRTILGTDQKAWFKEQLQSSTATWKLVGNQVIFSKFNAGWLTLLVPFQSFYEFESLFLDSWQGFPAERQEIFDFINDNDIQNVVFATGDIHIGIGFEVVADPNSFELVDTGNLQNIPIYTPSEAYDPTTGEGALAIEFVTPSITTSNFDEIFGEFAASVIPNFLNQDITTVTGVEVGNPNPHLKYADLTRHGYYILDVKPDSVQANWYYSPIEVPTQELTFDQAWYSLNGSNHLQMAMAPSPPKPLQDLPAPLEVPLSTSLPGSPSVNPPISILGLYPNPFREKVTLLYGLSQSKDLSINIYNEAGKLIKKILQERQATGVHTLSVDLQELPSGIYYFNFQSGQELISIKGIRLK